MAKSKAQTYQTNRQQLSYSWLGKAMSYVEHGGLDMVL